LKIVPVPEGSSTIVGNIGKYSSLGGVFPGVRPSESAIELPLSGPGAPATAGAVLPPVLGNLTVPTGIKTPGMIFIDELHNASPIFGMMIVISSNPRAKRK
jgi:hypothetical protein